MKALVTGSAGFIGSSVARQLLALDNTVIGLDNLNDLTMFRPSARLEPLLVHPNYSHSYSDLAALCQT